MVTSRKLRRWAMLRHTVSRRRPIVGGDLLAAHLQHEACAGITAHTQALRQVQQKCGQTFVGIKAVRDAQHEALEGLTERYSIGRERRLIHAGQFGSDFVAFVFLGDIHGRHAMTDQLAAPERFDIEQHVPEGGRHRATVEVVEQVVHLLAQFLQRAPKVGGQRMLGALAKTP